MFTNQEKDSQVLQDGGGPRIGRQNERPVEQSQSGEGEIGICIKELYQKMEQNNILLVSLKERLQPILGPQEKKEPGPDKDVPVKSSVARCIVDFIRSADSQREQIRELLHLIQL